MVAVKKHIGGGYVFSSLIDSEKKRQEAILLYDKHEKDILAFISANKKTSNDVGFYHSVGMLIRKHETKNADNLRYIKERVRYIFDENNGGLKKDTGKINYCDYCYELSKFKLGEVEGITHSCWVYLFQCSSLSNVLFDFVLGKSDEEKKLIKIEGLHRSMGKFLTLVLKNVNTEYWSSERKKIPISFSYTLAKGLFDCFDMKNRAVHPKVGDTASQIISSTFGEYLSCFSDQKNFSDYIDFVINKTKKDLKLFL